MMAELTQPWDPKQCFEGLVFAASEAEWQTFQGLRLSCESIIGAGSGRAVTFENGKVDCTHILTRHQDEASYKWGKEAHKILVNPLWLWESYEADEQLPLQDPMYHPFPARAIPGASGFQVTVTGVMGSLRIHVLDLMACMGVEVCKAMPPHSITHVIAGDLHDNTSKKLVHAREVQTKRRVCIINCLWVFDCLRAWKFVSEDCYTNNPDPGQDPVHGARVCASYLEPVSSLGGAIQDSEDEEEPPHQRGGLHPGSKGRHRTPAAHTQDPGMLVTPITDIPSSSRAGAQEGAWRSKHTGNSSRSRLGQAGASGPTSAPGAAQKENLHPSSLPPTLRLEDMLREGPALHFQAGSESQVAPEQVAECQAMAGRLADQLAPCDTQPAQAADDDLAADMAEEEHNSWHGADEAPADHPVADVAPDERAEAEAAAEEERRAEGRPATEGRQPGRRKEKKAPEATEQPAKKRKLLSRKAATAPLLMQQRCSSEEPPAAVEEPQIQRRKPPKGRKAAQRRGRSATPAQDAGAAVSEAAELPESSNPPKGRKAAQKRAQPAAPAEDAGAADAEAAEVPESSNLPKGKRAARKRAKSATPPSERQSPACQTPAADPPQVSPQAGAGPTPGTEGRPGSAKRVFIALSGLHTSETREFKRLLQDLKIGHTSGLEKHVWEDRVTHVVAPNLKRVAKVLAAMAAGAWVVSTQFLTASHSARKLVDPDDYELEDNDADLMAQSTPYHWRMRAHALSHGAFRGLKVHVLGKFKADDKPNRAAIESILKAGGAKVVDAAEAASADLVIVHRSLAHDDSKVKPLVRAKVCCVRSEYIVEWLAKPKADLSQYVLFKMKPGSALSQMAKERHLHLDPAQSASL